jgi:hypothetical protein
MYTSTIESFTDEALAQGNTPRQGAFNPSHG